MSLPCHCCSRELDGPDPDSRFICSPCRAELRVEIPIAHPRDWTFHHHRRVDRYGNLTDEPHPQGPTLTQETNNGRILAIWWQPDYWTSNPRAAEKWPATLQIGAVTLACPDCPLHIRPPADGYGVSGPSHPHPYGLHGELNSYTRPYGHNRYWTANYRSLEAALDAAEKWVGQHGDGWLRDAQLALL